MQLKNVIGGLLVTMVRHRNGVVGVGQANVVDDHRRRVVGRSVADLVLVRAVSPGYQRYPGGGLSRYRKAGVGVAGLAIMWGGGQHDQAFRVPLWRVFPVAAALRFLRVRLRVGRVQVGNVDEGCVPLLPLGHGEVQTQQMDEAEREQPGGEGQTAAGRDDRTRGHDGPQNKPVFGGCLLNHAASRPNPKPQPAGSLTLVLLEGCLEVKRFVFSVAPLRRRARTQERRRPGARTN